MTKIAPAARDFFFVYLKYFFARGARSRNYARALTEFWIWTDFFPIYQVSIGKKNDKSHTQTGVVRVEIQLISISSNNKSRP